MGSRDLTHTEPNVARGEHPTPPPTLLLASFASPNCHDRRLGVYHIVVSEQRGQSQSDTSQLTASVMEEIGCIARRFIRIAGISA